MSNFDIFCFSSYIRMFLFLLVLCCISQYVQCDKKKAADAIQSAVFGLQPQANIQVQPKTMAPIYRKKTHSKFSSRRRRRSSQKSSSKRPYYSKPVSIAFLQAAPQGLHRGPINPSISKTQHTQSPSNTTTHGGFAALAMKSVHQAPKQQHSFYRPSSYESHTIPTIDPCQVLKCHLSIALVLDSSGSVGEQNFNKQLGFVQTFLEILAVKAHDAGLKVCTGVVRYSTQPKIIANPCCRNTLCSLLTEFSQIKYIPGSTNTAGALKVARQMLQAPASYKKVAVLITDGRSNTGGSPITFATEMRNVDGIDIVALGVTDSVNERELKGISGFDFVTKIEYFDEFHGLADILLEANAMGTEEELETSLEQICASDNSTFVETC